MALTVKLPLMLDTPNWMAFTSFRVTLLAVVTETELAKLLEASFNVTLKESEPGFRETAPVTATAALWVMAPLELTVRVPLIVEPPNTMAFTSFRVTLFAEVTVTAPEKLLFGLAKVIVPADVASSVVPKVTLRAVPVSCEIKPLEVTASVPVTFALPKRILVLSTKVTILPETTVTAPVKLLLVLLRLILDVPGFRLVVPLTFNPEVAPVWSIPGAITFRLPEAFKPNRLIAELSLRVTSSKAPVPPVVPTEIAPLNSLRASKIMDEPAAVVNEEDPLILSGPD